MRWNVPVHGPLTARADIGLRRRAQSEPNASTPRLQWYIGGQVGFTEVLHFANRVPNIVQPYVYGRYEVRVAGNVDDLGSFVSPLMGVNPALYPNGLPGYCVEAAPNLNGLFVGFDRCKLYSFPTAPEEVAINFLYDFSLDIWQRLLPDGTPDPDPVTASASVSLFASLVGVRLYYLPDGDGESELIEVTHDPDFAFTTASGRVIPLGAPTLAPEPVTFALLGSGLLALAGVALRRRVTRV